jgi:hypothetical protein
MPAEHLFVMLEFVFVFVEGGWSRHEVPLSGNDGCRIAKTCPFGESSFRWALNTGVKSLTAPLASSH